MLKALATACKLQKQYGQTEAELETLVEGFSMILSDYPMLRIIEAMTHYVRKHPDIPRPSDIEAILNPPRPKPAWPAYIGLKKRIHDGYFPLDHERQFLRDCERSAIDQLADENDNFNEAQRQISQHKLLTHDD